MKFKSKRCILFILKQNLVFPTLPECTIVIVQLRFICFIPVSCLPYKSRLDHGSAEMRVPLSIPQGVKNFSTPNTALVIIKVMRGPCWPCIFVWGLKHKLSKIKGTLISADSPILNANGFSSSTLIYEYIAPRKYVAVYVEILFSAHGLSLIPYQKIMLLNENGLYIDPHIHVFAGTPHLYMSLESFKNPVCL